VSPRSNPPATEDAQVRPFYARVLRLRYFRPSGLVCFILLEGSVAAALMLALAELVSWWGLIVLPVAVALSVKANDLIVGRVARSADRVVQREREMLQREAGPAVGRAAVPGVGAGPIGFGMPAPSTAPRFGAVPGGVGAAPPIGRATVPITPMRYDERVPAADRRGTVYASRVRADDQAEGAGTDRSGWSGGQPAVNGGPPAWPGQPESRDRQSEWPGDQPERNGNQSGRNGGQSETPGQQWGWPGVRPGWSSGEHRYG
jgi:hypothetical protein